jgi:hypothetical protein
MPLVETREMFKKAYDGVIIPRPSIFAALDQ